VTDEIANNETPSQHLEAHDLTRQLARLGVTEEQRQAMRFRGTNKGWPIDLWSFEFLNTTPPQAMRLIKAYCALKWLILENPPYSRDKEDAWRLVNETMIAPIVAMGLRTKDAQSKRAKNPRGKVTSGGATIGQLIESLALQPQHRSDTARELWDHFYCLLEMQELYPKEVADPASPTKHAYEYDFGEGRKKVTFRRFANVVSRARRAKSR
jgi:hypothetical protein